MESLQVSIDSIKKNVKDNLGVIVLALIRGRAMTGLDIMKTIHMEFDVLLSPGAVYPLLDSLQRRGLLSSLRVGKERVYETTIESKTEIQQLIHDQIQARKLLNNYLQSKSNLFTETDQLGDSATRPTLRPRIRGPWLD
jgi:DNA-binding PadR family transcriptional regulator